MAPEEGTPPERAGEAPAWLQRIGRAARIDLAPPHRQPSVVLFAVATIAAVGLSLAADGVVVAYVHAHYPATRHFSHFRTIDYATLTVVGVLMACGAWPVVTHITAAPRRLFFRLAVGAVALLWLPDLWLLARHEVLAGIGALMLMHLAIALITYNLLVRVARVRRPRPGEEVARGSSTLSERAIRRVWGAMAAVVAVEMVLGVVTIISVPYRRPNTVFPPRGILVYAAHGGLGIALAGGAVLLLVLSAATGRMARIGAEMGAAGIATGVLGGVLASFQSTRLIGMAVMLVGVLVAGLGYLAPMLEAMGRAEVARAAAARAEMARQNAERASVPGTNGKTGGASM